MRRYSCRCHHDVCCPVFFAALAHSAVIPLEHLSPTRLHKIISKGRCKKSNPESFGVLQRCSLGHKYTQYSDFVWLPFACVKKLCGSTKCVPELSGNGGSGFGILCWRGRRSNFLSWRGRLHLFSLFWSLEMHYSNVSNVCFWYRKKIMSKGKLMTLYNQFWVRIMFPDPVVFTPRQLKFIGIQTNK